MYIPEYFRVEDRAAALAFMRANPFAIVVSLLDGSPFATHIPLLARNDGDSILVRGHFARANPHCKRLNEGGETLVIFHGPHAYVSPHLYESRASVPTWNYAAVHAYGRPRILSGPEALTELLLESITAFDASYIEQWREMDGNFRDKMLTQIVGFEMPVERLEAKFKLSQNRPKADQARVIEALAGSAGTAAAGVAALMKDRGLGTGGK